MSLPVCPVVISSSHADHTYIVCRLKNGSHNLGLTSSPSDLVVQSSFFFPESSPRDLQFGHGFRACSFKNNGKVCYSYFLEVFETRKLVSPPSRSDLFVKSLFFPSPLREI